MDAYKGKESGVGSRQMSPLLVIRPPWGNYAIVNPRASGRELSSKPVYCTEDDRGWIIASDLFTKRETQSSIPNP